MKIFLPLILLLSIASWAQDSRTISIIKNQQNEFEIVNNGKSIYKYNIDDNDSSTLSILSEIYSKSNKDSFLSTNINILNLPSEGGIDWINIIIPIGVILLTYMTTRLVYNRQVRAENKRAWLEKVRIEGARMLYISDFLLNADKRLKKINKGIQSTKDINQTSSDEELNVSIQKLNSLQKESNDFLELSSKLEDEFRESYHRFKFLFDFKLHLTFLERWTEFSESLKAKEADSQVKLNLFSAAMHRLINEEQKKLDDGKF